MKQWEHNRVFTQTMKLSELIEKTIEVCESDFHARDERLQLIERSTVGFDKSAMVTATYCVNGDGTKMTAVDEFESALAQEGQS